MPLDQARDRGDTRSGGPLLLTGATGFVGMEILARYLERSSRQVYVLVRASTDAEADARVRATLTSLFGRDEAHALSGRVVALRGDLQAPDLGIEPRRRELIAERVSTIIHAAASVSFSLPLPEARAINVTGTRRLLELGELCQERGGLVKFSHVSTAYVAGDHAGTFGEDQLDVGQGFHNSYERSKFEAERLVRAYRDRLPIEIFRPSIVVGERTSGWTTSFNVLYTPLKAFARGALPVVPARPSAPVDVVPVDYVADAIFELSSKPQEGSTYHLVAGSQATTVGRLMDLSAAHLERRRPLVVPPQLFKRLVLPLLLRLGGGDLRRGLERTKIFFPYFSVRARYRNEDARSRLEPAGIRLTPIEEYYGRLLRYALQTGWGRKKIGRAEALAQAEESAWHSRAGNVAARV